LATRSLRYMMMLDVGNRGGGGEGRGGGYLSVPRSGKILTTLRLFALYRNPTLLPFVSSFPQR
jgi:hypothetical protein